MKDSLIDILSLHDISITNEQAEKFLLFKDLLIEWNKKINLTSIENDKDIFYKHFLDSLLCLKLGLNWNGKKVIDIGTGAGFPGVPLKIVLGDKINLNLFDSLQKRISYLEAIIEDLNLGSVSAVHGRAEDFGRNNLFREKFDIVTARAVAKLPVLLEICLPFVKPNGYFIAMKGPDGLNELSESSYALGELGAELYLKKEFSLRDDEYTRLIFVFKKIKVMHHKYPRKSGIPQKKPLIKPNG
ncbi:MAG: 16S rRNA (guanine(527)-N(7))-methyltransferase RsmG [Bacillota bacterium]